MLKPRAETGGEKKSKPSTRMVNPRFAAREATKVALFDNPEQRAFDAAKAKGLKAGSKQFNRLEAKAKQANFKKMVDYYGLPKPKNGKSYTPKEQARNAKLLKSAAADSARTDKGRRANALGKSVNKSFPVQAEAVFGAKRMASVNKALTRQGAGAKGGGKVRKTDMRAKVSTRGGQVVTVDARGRKTVQYVKNMVTAQTYSKGGKVAKGENARKQTETRFAGESAPVRRGTGSATNKGAKAKAQKQQFTKKTTTKATGGKAPAKQTPAKTPTAKNTTKPAKAVTTKNTTKTTPAPKPAAPAKAPAQPKFTPEQIAAQNRLLGKKNTGAPAKDDDFFGKGPAPLTTPKGEKPSIADTLRQIRGNKPKKGKK